MGWWRDSVLLLLTEFCSADYTRRSAFWRVKMSTSDFYLRYYVGHKGKFGHEFLEFEFRPDGKLRYANNSNYKNDVMIRKEAYVHKSVMEELKRIIDDNQSKDPEGLRVFYFLVQDLKCLV